VEGRDCHQIVPKGLEKMAQFVLKNRSNLDLGSLKKAATIAAFFDGKSSSLFRVSPVK